MLSLSSQMLQFITQGKEILEPKAGSQVYRNSHKCAVLESKQ